MNIVPALAALAMAIGVGTGAFGAHALKDTLSTSDMAIWEKAVLYHLVHALGALVVAMLASNFVPPETGRKIALLILVSTAIFSGSLYTLVLSGQRWLGMITPLGGTGFIIAWLWLAWTFFRSPAAS